jgi:hypothetical protein
VRPSIPSHLRYGRNMPTVAPPARVMPGKTEFVLMIASVMMLVAFGIDSMLPALPAIGNDLGVSDPNDRPIVISAFLAGFGVTLLVIGTVSDRYGRRTPMLFGLLTFAIANVVAALSQDFTQLLVARFVQGMAAAAGQTVVRSVVRARHGTSDEPCEHDLHGGPDPCASAGATCARIRAVALDFRGARADRLWRVVLGRVAAPRNAFT